MSKPLHLDIGCGKGGFLLNMTDSDMSYNYLGLEIRPLVAQFARERIAIYGYTGHLDYVGCNANVDLDRTLSRYQQAVPNRESLALQRVSIQFPDPHFKTAHAKRRLVTQELVSWLAAFMPPQATVFLQSDIKEVLDDMRMRFREYPVYFQDTLEDTAAYLPQNVLGVPTEREVSVLGKELPVYRALFTRTAEDYAQNKEASLPLS
jgi:tRNA (guanine-N7-)-methyltransferase